MNKLLKILPLTVAFFLFNFSTQGQVSQKNQDVSITNIGFLNSDALDFSPTFYREGVVFVSSRNKDRKEDDRINEPFFDLYFADLSARGMPGPPQQFSVKINSAYHEGPVSFNKAGDQIFFTRTNLSAKNKLVPNAQGIVKMKIYTAEKGDTEWGNIQELPFNNNEYSCMHPTIDVENQRLYFASDMPGGEGGMDIYYSDLIDGVWTVPMNAGPKVNTSYNEVFPFIHSSGVLYFSSDNAGGKGGFDIYRLMPDEEIPFAQPMGEPFNSNKDDFGLIVSDNGTSGFFTSARSNGQGKDDVYAFNAPNGLEGIPQPTQFLSSTFFVYDAVTKEPIPNAGILLFNANEKDNLAALYDVDVTQFDNDELGLKITLTNKGLNALPNLYTDRNGNAYAKIAANRQFFILSKKEGYEPQETIYETFNKAENDKISIPMYPTVKFEKTVKTVVIEEGTTLVADKIFYDFDKSYIRVGAAKDLDAVVILMKKYPEVEIDLTAHTDSRGDKLYNQKLSEQRAISAKNYLVANGIEGFRIRTFGKGESTPRNGCKDGVRCSELEHQYNRRTEIFIRKMASPEKIIMKNNQPETIDTIRD